MKRKWYVIKNNNTNEYYDGSSDDDCWSSNINFAYFFYDKSDAEHKKDVGWSKYKFNDDCEIIELCEDDEEYQELKEYNNKLKHQLAEYENFMRENEWSNIDEMRKTLNKCEEKYKKQCNQLVEKDKEIERLKTPCEYFINYNNHIVRKLPLGEEEIVLTPKEICDLLNGYTHEFMNYQERIIKIRHQVCEEIMQKVNTNDFQVFGTKALKVNKYVKQILDQIEQGESK